MPDKKTDGAIIRADGYRAQSLQKGYQPAQTSKPVLTMEGYKPKPSAATSSAAQKPVAAVKPPPKKP